MPKTDEAKNIIKWAVDHGFGVIDINIPPNLTEDLRNKNVDLTDTDRRKSLTEKLALYIWENYVESVRLLFTFHLNSL